MCSRAARRGSLRSIASGDRIMALQDFTGRTVGTTATAITSGDDVIVRYGAVVGNTATFNAAGITAYGTNHDIDIYGHVFGGTWSISLGSNSAIAGSNVLTVHATGVLTSTVEGVLVTSSGSLITNAGLISGTYGIFIAASGSTTSTIVNSGSIIGAGDSLYAAIEQYGSEKLVLTNTGLIAGVTTSFNGSFVPSNLAVTEITNSGRMIGDVLLGGADDLYDGRLGSILGVVYGGSGNDVLQGGTGNETLDGGADDDQLEGNAGTDTLIGGTGNDSLDGGTGADRMEGGSGNDTYYVDNTGDVVTESTGEGTDTVNAAISYALTANVENLVLSGTDDIDGTGNDLDNTLTGNDGDNSLSGGAGTDTLYGADGNDVLDGGTGADTMEGGIGNDTFHVDDAGDVVTENSGAGTDTVNASITYALTANVENLVLTGTGNINGTGNDLANSLTGNAGNNVLNGGTGGDRMEGGQGNDIYYVDNVGDVVVEAANAGTDTVRASRSYTLGANVENLLLTGTANLSGTGNSLANVITGNSGNNTLSGLAGNDTLRGEAGNDRLTGGTGADKLYGGTGADRFVFTALSDSTVSSSGRDTIYDFSHSQGDRIDLSAIDASTRSSGNQAFSFIGEKAFTGKAGELRYVNSGGDTFIYADVNGDRKSDFSIRIDANIDLVKGDFVL
ncbi:calcium-binding protein [Ciceribacter sp. L1K22]|nr:calcium-binding protein [Ciceribacter sp. L1K22]